MTPLSYPRRASHAMYGPHYEEAGPAGTAVAPVAGPGGSSRRALTLDEEVILASDRKRSPLTVGVVAETDAAFDAARLRGSLHRALRRHPIARARLARGVGTVTCWDFPAESDLPVDVIHEVHTGGADGAGTEDVWRAVESLCSRPFNLGAEPPVRLLLAHRPVGDVVALIAHHVAMDGLSVLALLREIIDGCAVERRYRPPAAAQVPHGPAVMLRRPHQPKSRRHCSPRPGRLRTGPYLVPCGSTLAQGYGVYPVDLPVPPPVVLADGRRMTVNDLLIAAAHLAVERWNHERGRRSGTVRVRMPLAGDSADSADSPDSADPTDAADPADPAGLADAAGPGGPEDARVLGNWTGQVVITSTSAVRAVPRRLTSAVVDQTSEAKARAPRWAGAGTTTTVVAVTAALPTTLRSVALRCGVAAARPFLTPSVAVSNLGRVDLGAGPDPHAGRITGLSFIATSGMPQGLLICVAGNGDRLRLTFCHHLRLFDRAGVVRFADIYQQSLLELTTPQPQGSE